MKFNKIMQFSKKMNKFNYNRYVGGGQAESVIADEGNFNLVVSLTLYKGYAI